jgi:MFS family permease
VLKWAGGALPRLFVALLFSQSAFSLYWAALPLYFATLGFDPAQVGLLIGAAGLAELIGALIVGPSIDRLGGRVLLLVGTGCYLVASLGYSALQAVPALIALRLVQGFGLAAVLPSAYSFVPHLVGPRRQTVTFASIGAGGNIAGAICPPLGLALLQVAPNALFGGAAVAAVLAAAFTLMLPSVGAASRRAFGLAFRAAWLAPLLVSILSVIQWGVISAFLPLEASTAGANPGLLFTADAICVLASRVPAGWIADRYGPLRLALLGVISMTASPLVLLLPLNDGVLMVAGLFNGVGAGLTLPPMMAQLSQRSDDSTRGSALSYFSVAFAIGMLLGASGGGVLFAWLGFHGLLIVGAALCVVGVAALLLDAIVQPHVRGAAIGSGAPT